MAGELILVVEDNQNSLKLIRDILAVHGFRILEATSGRTAVELARSEKPDLILMDLQLPEVDGLKATRLLKESGETRSIPIIAVTAFAMKGDREVALAAGCDGYISKPIDTRELPQQVVKYLGAEKGGEAETDGDPSTEYFDR